MKIEIITPQFERPAGVPAPSVVPGDWADLANRSMLELVSMGCGNWDGGLALFPAEWYPHIPEGMALATINGGVETFAAGVSDDDTRYGCLPYGVRVGPPIDDE